ncbi:DUF2590 family protein [Endozoicomonas sp. GU-1]|uniref:DUF2590 family protein n=1 Tax=Endozoicomonas sp. GU-1 TaxID=3009078 RepID=UPI0022B3CF52|nr:DUF2590 family protein [Endozoicomonas sp. GU-1]WBA86529.1 DUF2590 family protein [Endozoicomonas sp. GU-1]
MSTQAEQWHDILITDRDLALDVAGIPQQVTDRGTIAQDIKHMLMDTGLVVQLVGERSASQWQLAFNQIELQVEEDRRIIPGTVVIHRPEHNILYLTADTELGPVDVYIPMERP